MVFRVHPGQHLCMLANREVWDTLITDGKCLDYALNILLTCIFNIITDISILLPSRAVWKLQIAAKRKFAIVSVFGIGLLFVYHIEF